MNIQSHPKILDISQLKLDNNQAMLNLVAQELLEMHEKLSKFSKKILSHLLILPYSNNVLMS